MAVIGQINLKQISHDAYVLDSIQNYKFKTETFIHKHVRLNPVEQVPVPVQRQLKTLCLNSIFNKVNF